MKVQELILDLLQKEFDAEAQIELIDEAGDQRHWLLRIVSMRFDGLSRLDRSRKVYEILNDLINDDTIHALRMELKTPSEI